MKILDKLMNRNQGEWFNPAFFPASEQSMQSEQADNIQPESSINNVSSANQEQIAEPAQQIQGRLQPQPTQQQIMPTDPTGQSQISQGEGVNSTPAENNTMFSQENINYLTNLGYSAEDIQSAMSNYTPQQGGFFEQVFRKSMPAPGQLDEDKLKKMRNMSALSDALALVAQFAGAASGGDIKERKFSEMASGQGAAAEKDLRKLYRGLNEKYAQGLMSAAGKDAQLGYNKWLATRKAILSTLQGKQTAEDKRVLADLNHTNRMKQINTTQEAQTARSEANNKARRENLEYTQEQTNKRHGETLAQREKHNKESNAIRWAGVQNTKARNEIASRREQRMSVPGGRSGSATGSKTKSIVFPVEKGTPGAEFDEIAGVSYIPLDLAPEQFSAFAAQARAALSNPQTMRDYSITSAPRNDEDAIRMYVEKIDPSVLDRIKQSKVVVGDAIAQDMKMINSWPIEKVVDMAKKDAVFKQATGFRKKNNEPDAQFNERIAAAYKEWYSKPESWEDESLNFADIIGGTAAFTESEFENAEEEDVDEDEVDLSEFDKYIE